MNPLQMRIASLLLLACITILLVSHYLLGYNYKPLIVLWICVVAITIGPVLELVYGTTYDDDDYDDEYLSDSYYDQSDLLPRSEEMEEEYQPYE